MAHEKVPERSPHGRESGGAESHGRQLIDETQRSIAALMEGMAHGHVDMENPAMRDAVFRELGRMQQLLERSARMLRRVRPEEDAASRFAQFSEDFRRDVERQSEIFRHREEQYRRGDISSEEYGRVVDDRNQLYAAMEQKMRDHAMGLDAEDPAFLKTYELLQDKLPPLPSVDAGDRLNQLWGRLEKNLMPFVKAYAEIQELLRLGRAKPEDLQEAWREKRGAYERMCARIFKLKGINPVEAAELEDRARNIVRPEEPMPFAAASIHAVHAMHEKARASYTAVQHTLDIEQRRQMRSELAHLTALVRQAELAEVISHATEQAPLLAHASLASKPTVATSGQTGPAPRRRGLAALLGDAFRLK